MARCKGDHMDARKWGAGRGVSVMGPIAGAFIAGFVGVATFHQGSGWLFNMIGIYPVAQVQDAAVTSFRSASGSLAMLLGRPMGNRARVDAGASAARELLAACVRVWPDRAAARWLVRRAAHQRHADHGWAALADPGGASAADRHMGRWHGMAIDMPSTRISPGVAEGNPSAPADCCSVRHRPVYVHGI